jgi:thiosulfate dehydrogenase
MNTPDLHQKLSASVRQLMWVLAVLALTLIVAATLHFNRDSFNQSLSNETASTDSVQTENPKNQYWQAPDINLISDPSQKELVLYGKELIAHTSKYLGPKGSVAQISNGMNCQNCHLEAGTKVFGNNYGSVAATYPKFRARSGTEEDIYKRVNDCFERSLNGKALDTLSKEMQAIKAYISYIGSNVQKGKKAEGAGFKELAFLDRAANPKNGKLVYEAKCQSCHQANGEGLLNADGTEYSFPPLWGKNSYNNKAGLYRITFFARYAKYNMPLGASHENPQLSDEEAWDIAAFVNTQPRPTKETPKDWPDISQKPIDHPFGPFSDGFSEEQHKYGPFKPIKAAKEAQSKKQS